MNPVRTELGAGLYLIATPIGAARDITLRALDLLNAADVLAAEDTRTLRKLMDIHGIPVRDRPLISYHDHNAQAARPKILAALQEGKSVVYASEAGTPMISDPGFDLARAVVDAGFGMWSAPGPSAAVTALTVSGLPADRFFFAGFLPPKSAKRKSALRDVAEIPGTLILYESPNRICALLTDAIEVLGSGRPAALCRELTKKFEEVRRGTLEELAASVADHPVKGELVVLIGRAEAGAIREFDTDAALRDALKTHSVRDAADMVAKLSGAKRREVYQRALMLDKEAD